MYASEVFESEKGSEGHAKRRRVKSDKAVAEGKAFFTEVLHVVTAEDEEAEEADEVLVPDTHGDDLEELPSANLLSQPGGMEGVAAEGTPPIDVPDTLLPVEDVTPPSEDVSPPSEGVSPPLKDVTPPSKGEEGSQSPVEKPTPPQTAEGKQPTPTAPTAHPRQSWESVDAALLPPPPPRSSDGSSRQDEPFSLVPDEFSGDVFSKDTGTEAENVKKLLWEDDAPPEEVKLVVPVAPSCTMLQVGDALRWCVTQGRPHRGLLKVIQSSMVEPVAAEADASNLFRTALLAFLVTDGCDIPGPLAPLPPWQEEALAANAPPPLFATFQTLSPPCVRCRLQWAKSLLKSASGILHHLPANSPFLPPPASLRSDFHRLHSQHAPECPMYKRSAKSR